MLFGDRSFYIPSTTNRDSHLRFEKIIRLSFFMNQNILNDRIEEKIAKKEEVIQHLTRELKDVKNFAESIIPSFLNNPDDQDTRKEGWMRKKDQTEFPVGFTINNHLSIRGEQIGKIVVFRDLTNVYKIQEEN